MMICDATGAVKQGSMRARQPQPPPVPAPKPKRRRRAPAPTAYFAAAAAIAAVSALPFFRWQGGGDVGGEVSGRGCPGLEARGRSCFSESYPEAREKFRSATAAASAAASAAAAAGDELDIESHVLEVAPAFTMDVAVVRGKGPGLVVHTSGLHGVEGYAGSAVQVAYLHRLAEERAERAAAGAAAASPTVVLFHAVNPHGMAHFRRCNENNVDLNRNALRTDEWDDVLLRRDPNLAGYDDFDLDLFNPPRPPTAADAYWTYFLRAAWAVARHGFVAMKRAIVSGQYHRPGGISFGGRELQPSHRLLRDFLIDGGFATPGVGPITWIDVHTGLGPPGVDTLLAHGTRPDEEGNGEAEGGHEGRADRWFPDAPRQVQYFFGQDSGGGDGESDGYATGGPDDVSAGYDLTMGILNGYYAALFEERAGPASRPLVVAQEFGTVPAVLVARALILENMAHHHSPPAERAYWATFSRDAFYVRTDEWRESVLRRGLTVLEQAIHRSSLPVIE